MSLLRLSITAAAVVAGVLACGDDTLPDPDDGGSGGLGGLDSGGDGGAAGMGGVGGLGGSTDVVVLEIRDLTFVPPELVVAPGDIIEVRNLDDSPHEIVNSSRVGGYTSGSVNGVRFRTSFIDPGASERFTIPDTAPSGTVIPYYCGIFTWQMTNADEARVVVE